MNVKRTGLTGVNWLYPRVPFGRRINGTQFRRWQRKPRIHNSL